MKGYTVESQNQLIDLIKTICKEHWEKNKHPFLLSALSSKLATEFPNYHDALGTRRLKGFIEETGSQGEYKLAEHPKHKAKVGVIPSFADFSYPQDSLPQHTRQDNNINTKEATLAFFQALATLPEHDADKVIIPASILIKLFK